MEETELFKVLNNHPEVVLYFNSILMDKDLENTLNFVKNLNQLSQREILCENTGLAYELKKSDYKILFQCSKCGKQHRNKRASDDELTNLPELIKSYDKYFQ